jgi:hypothetical protein
VLNVFAFDGQAEPEGALWLSLDPKKGVYPALRSGEERERTGGPAEGAETGEGGKEERGGIENRYYNHFLEWAALCFVGSISLEFVSASLSLP